MKLMNITLSTFAKMYLDKCYVQNFTRFKDMIDGIGRFEGDIVKLKGKDNLYRLMKQNRRILFRHEPGSTSIHIEYIYRKGDKFNGEKAYANKPEAV